MKKRRFFLVVWMMGSVAGIGLGWPAHAAGRMTQPRQRHVWDYLPNTFSLATADGLFQNLQNQATRVSAADLRKIPRWDSSDQGDIFLRSRYAGRFVVTPDDHARVWFVAPGDLRRYYFDGSQRSREFLQAFDPIGAGKNIAIVLSKQQLQERYGNLTLAAYQISSGKLGHRTPTGTYKILNKIPRAWSRLAQLWMPWWLAFTVRGHGIHELPEWPNGQKEGAKHLGKPVSHGCVRLGIGPAKQLYDWADVGTPVIIKR